MRLNPAVRAFDTHSVCNQDGRPAGLDGLRQPGHLGQVGVNRGVVEVGPPSPDPVWLVLGQQRPEAFLDRSDGADPTGRVGSVEHGGERTFCLPDRCSAPVSSSLRFTPYTS